MSDHAESSDEEEEAPRKPIPAWAQGPALADALHAQYGGSGLNPERIFSTVQTCDLEAIFQSNRRRYRQRTSSANWLPDRSTAEERERYRSAMGWK